MDIEVTKVNGRWNIMGQRHHEIPNEITVKKMTWLLEVALISVDGLSARLYFALK